jgi:hypothetical protein
LTFSWIFLAGAQGLDVTGRVSFRLQNTSYNENSEIKPDSISDSNYGKTTLVPGLQQSLNVALFGRTRDLDMTLLADLRNNNWNRLEPRNLNSISRFTLNMHVRTHQIILGDFFESMSESFLQSREIRGLKYGVTVPEALGGNSFISLLGVGGVVQPAISLGDNLQDLYRQYETSGQFRRWLAATTIRGGVTGTLDVGVKYLWAKDDEHSIEETINDPVANRVMGGDLSLFLWDRNIRLFGEYLGSQKDTLSAQAVTDNAYNGGIDFSYQTFKFLIAYQKFGYQYFTAGFPFLETDRQGIRGQIAYAFPQAISFLADFEVYQNNLDNLDYLPTTDTQILDFSINSQFPNLPEFGLVLGLRTDLSNKVTDSEDQTTKVDKLISKLEGRVNLNFNSTRFSLSGIYQDLNDKSLIPNSEPLGTEQLIASFNFYTTSGQFFFISGGAVYSDLTLTNNQTNRNIYLYESNRWDIIPRKLSLETTITYLQNSADGGGTADNLANYDQINGEVSLEFFFTNQLSFRALAGTDSKKFKYSTDDALQIIADPDYGPEYFNGNESYNGLIFGGEFNWIF